MSAPRLIAASLRYYAATNAMVVLGVAVAVAVLAGALLVGESVRESLRRIALGRLGATEVVVTSPTSFRSALADAVQSGSAVSAVPLILAQGAVTHDESRRTAARVSVYAIDDRFWRFHGIDADAPTGRDALVSPALAAELGARDGDGITLRVARPTDIPLSTLQGRRDITGQRTRLSIARVLDAASLADFSLAPSQGPVLAIYVSLARLQQDLDLPSGANALLVKGIGTNFQSADFLRSIVGPASTMDDLGLRVRPSPAGETIIESRAGFIPDPLADQVAQIASRNARAATPVLTYVANSIRTAAGEIPYSTITALDSPELRADKWSRPLWLNEWAAADLGGPKVGETISLEYFIWTDEEGLETRSAEFTFAGVVPMAGLGGDETLTPQYPGISDAADITSWDPPFPVDLGRVRKQDEDYWDRYRAAPKAFIQLAEGQRLWGSRYGRVSSLRLSGTTPLTPGEIDITTTGIVARHVRNDAAAASQGTTDFGEYFLYFSFFLVVSALLLAYVFFAVGLEQRTSEIGLLATVGFSPHAIRRSFIAEGAVLSAIGALVGAIAAVGYGSLIMYGLRTWWVGAVGTTELALHIAPVWLAAGVAGALFSGLAALWLGIRGMSRRSARALLKADSGTRTGSSSAVTKVLGGALLVGGAAAIGAAATGAIDQTAGFFGGGGAWLVGGLCAVSIALRRRRSSWQLGHGAAAMFRLGVSHTAVRPARSVLSVSLVAFASFVLVSVGAFHKDATTTTLDKASGVGGFTLMAESVAPLMHDPNTREGRDGLVLNPDDEIISATPVTRFRLRPGDEASCLTLYQPTNPRIIAPERRFFDAPRFTFAASMAVSPEEIANPWRLLERAFEDGAIPAIADQTTLNYVLHLGVGDDFTFSPDGRSTVRLRIVGALADSVLQSELIIGEASFVRLFPRNDGYRVWMLEAPPERTGEVTTHLEDHLSDYGVDVIDTGARWASYHQVENTYLATFQALGSLGLLLGTIGLGAVLARNVLERRRDLGLLAAVGYARGDIRRMVLSEGMTLVLGGLALGAACALVAIVPALRDRAQSLPLTSLAGVLLAVAVTGALASLMAVRIATRTPVVTAIKSE